MTDLEISRALALAIGWNLRNVILKDLYGTRLAQCWCFTGVQWVEFDYRDWNVIGPIAEKFNAFPSKWNTDSEKVWYAWDMVNKSTYTATTPQAAIAMAVIAAAKGGKEMKPNKSSPLIERLRDYADADTEEAADALERLAREKHEAQDCFDAAKAEIERLTAHDQFLADAKVEDRK